MVKIKLEIEAKKVRRRANIEKIILQTVVSAGFLSMAVVAPNALQALRIFDRGIARKMNPLYLIEPAFSRLCMKGMIVVEKTAGGKRVRVTEDGKRLLERMVARSPDSRMHKRWDKRWRMVIYDIREKRREVRRRIREILSAFGFYKLQASTWVYPYDCEDLVVLLKADFKIGQEVLYVIVEKIENDQKLKEHFGLK